MYAPAKSTERGCNNGTQKRRRARRPETIHADRKTREKHQRPTENLTRRHPIVKNHGTKKEGEAMNFKETMDILMKILAMVDKIYHAVVKEPEDNNDE